jgi:hypothetical protein
VWAIAHCGRCTIGIVAAQSEAATAAAQRAFRILVSRPHPAFVHPASVRPTFNPQFIDETATCLVVSDEISVMLLTLEKSQQFTPKSSGDATKSSEVLGLTKRLSSTAVKPDALVLRSDASFRCRK